MDIEKHRDLLQKLAHDDEVRSAFEANPASVLKAHGVDFDPAQLPSPATLPSKEELQRTFDKRMSAAGGLGAQMIPLPIWMPES